MIAGIISKPDSNPTKSKVRRGNPEYVSIPNVLRKRPSNPEIRPLIREPKATEAMAVNPNSATKKYSEGPNQSEIVAKGGASNKRTTPLISPPTTDANVEMRIA
jgi:hypothetical protein